MELHLYAPKRLAYMQEVLFKYAPPRIYSEFVLLEVQENGTCEQTAPGVHFDMILSCLFIIFTFWMYFTEFQVFYHKEPSIKYFLS